MENEDSEYSEYGSDHVKSVPPIMPLHERVIAAWGVLRGEYNTGIVDRLRKRSILYRFKPYVLEARFSSGSSVLMQCGEVQSVISYEKIARQELRKKAPWLSDAGELTYLRVIDRRSWLVSFEEGSP